MLLRPDGDATICIAQTSHAWLSGQIARRWRDLQPYEPLVLAATQHDIGWADWDRDPEVDPQTGLPRSFTAMPIASRMAIWGPAAQRLSTQSLHAALLVSLHGSWLHRDAEGAEGFLAEQRALQERWTAELGIDPETAERQRALLLLWDVLSLALCLRWDPYEHDGYTLTRRDGETFTLHPWPFAGDEPVELQCEGRRADSGALVTLHFRLERARL